MEDPYAPYEPKKQLSIYEKAQEALSWVPLIGSNSEKATRYTGNDTNEEGGGLMGKLDIWNRATTFGESISDKINDAQESAENYKLAIFLLILGGMVLFLST